MGETVVDEVLARDLTEGEHAPLTHFGGPTRIAVGILAAGAVAVGVVLRFVCHTPLWLDEALTVDISRLPLRDLHEALRRDGAPPLYYVLLHFWMKVFGQSDVGIRSLSGVLSVATLPVAWVAARNYGGRTMAWITLLLLATAPFAVAYATAARMYALVMFLTACGLVALQRVLRRPRPGNLVALAVVTSALLYSHYWSLYLVGAVGLWLVRQAVHRGRPRTNARWSLLAVAVGCLTFVPWVPTFLFQSAHTGTPWAKPPNLAAVVSTITEFTENQSATAGLGTDQARLLIVCYFAIGFLALFGQARDRWHVMLDLRTRSAARPLTFVVGLTLAVAVGGGILTSSSYSDRYAAVVFVPLILLLALGTLCLVDVRVRTLVMAVAVAAGLAGSVQNVTTQRTQAGQVAAVLASHARAGDVVAFCPDQLGPAVYRLVPQGLYRMTTYPRGTSPEFVDWVDYVSAIDRSPPARFVRHLLQLARSGRHHTIWLVWRPGYQGFGQRCETIATDLLDHKGIGSHDWVTAQPIAYYEAMQLTQFNVGGRGLR